MNIISLARFGIDKDNIEIRGRSEFENYGPLYLEYSNLCSYVVGGEYLIPDNVSVVFAPPNLAIGGDCSIVRSEYPQYEFFRVHNRLVLEDYYKRFPEIRDAKWAFSHNHPLAYVRRAVVGDGCEFRHAVIGDEGLRLIRTPQGGFLVCKHGGYVKIGNGVRIGAHSVVNRSMWRPPTQIGDNTHIANRVTIGHNCVIGNRVVIMPGVIVCGRAVVEDDAMICAGAIINNDVTVGVGAVVSAGSLVTRNVEPGQHVTGYFAMDHSGWVELIKRRITGL